MSCSVSDCGSRNTGSALCCSRLLAKVSMQSLQAHECSGLIALHQARVADHIHCQNGREPTLNLWRRDNRSQRGRAFSTDLWINAWTKMGVLVHGTCSSSGLLCIASASRRCASLTATNMESSQLSMQVGTCPGVKRTSWSQSCQRRISVEDRCSKISPRQYSAWSSPST